MHPFYAPYGAEIFAPHISGTIRTLRTEDYGNEPKEIYQTEFQEMLSVIKAQSDEIQNERTITEDDLANIVTSMLTSSGVGDFDQEETKMFYGLFKHILERVSCSFD